MSVIFWLTLGILMTTGVAFAYVEYMRQNSIEQIYEEVKQEVQSDYRRAEVRRDQDLENQIAAYVERRIKSQAPARKGYDVDMIDFKIYYDDEKDEIVWVTTYEFLEE